MRLIFASHNEKKYRELKEILKDLPIEIFNLNELNIKDDVVEDGLTFLENAILKAKSVGEIFDDYIIAEDAGLEVEALNMKPVIYSKRYSGLGDYQNNVKILNELKDVKNRKARFTSCLVLFKGTTFINSYFGYLEGTIDDKMSGTNDFGYDPIFIPSGYNVSAATLSLDEKNKISHRSQSLNLFIKDFLKVINSND